MSADADADAEAEDAAEVTAPEYGTQPEPVGMRKGRTRTERILSFLARRLHIVVGIALGVGAAAALILDVQLSRSQVIVVGSFAIAAVVFGYPTGRKAAELLGGPQLIWIVDCDLLDREGAGIITVPSPRWRDEWEVVEGELWWATPELAFGKKVDLDAQTVEGTWPGTVPEPVLARALSYILYNRKYLLDRAAAGDLLDVNSHAIIRDATRAETKQLVETFEAGTLPDDNEAFRNHVDDILDEWGISDAPLRPEDDETAEAPENGAAEQAAEFDFDQVEAAADD